MSTDELEKEVRISTFRSSPGGQHVGIQLYPLEAVHLPTGIKIVIPGDVVRSQHAQRQLALEGLMGILTSRYYR